VLAILLIDGKKRGEEGGEGVSSSVAMTRKVELRLLKST
jgi:hypothetical protein